MRRALLLVPILAMLCLQLPADPGGVYAAYRPKAPRTEAMGWASVASARHEEVLYANPALVGLGNDYVSLPTLTISLDNFNSLVQPGGALDIIANESDDPDFLERAVNQLINSIGPGEGDIGSFQMGAGFISGIAGLSIDMGIDLHSMGSGGESSTAVMEANMATTLAVAFPLDIGRHTISAGASAHLIFKGYTIESMGSSAPGGFNASSLSAIIDDEDTLSALLNGVPVAAGWAIPIDVGLAWRWNDILTAGLVFRNLNSTWRGETYNGVNQFYNSLTGGWLVDQAGDLESGVSWSFSQPWSLDLGFAVTTPPGGVWDWVDLTFAFDFTDAWNFFAGDMDMEGFVSRTRIGAEAIFMRTFGFRAGLNSGYISLGFKFDFQVFSLDVTYSTREYGENLGDKPLDRLSIRFRLGVES